VRVLACISTIPLSVLIVQAKAIEDLTAAPITMKQRCHLLGRRATLCVKNNDAGLPPSNGNGIFNACSEGRTQSRCEWKHTSTFLVRMSVK
jgi:hypothetical protein